MVALDIGVSGRLQDHFDRILLQSTGSTPRRSQSSLTARKPTILAPASHGSRCTFLNVSLHSSQGQSLIPLKRNRIVAPLEDCSTMKTCVRPNRFCDRGARPIPSRDVQAIDQVQPRHPCEANAVFARSCTSFRKILEGLPFRTIFRLVLFTHMGFKGCPTVLTLEQKPLSEFKFPSWVRLTS